MDLEKNVGEVSGLLKSIAHPLRLKILCLLQGDEKTVGELQGIMKTSIANISQHLNKMRNQGIIATRREANFIYNYIADERMLELMGTLQDLYCQNEKA